MLDIEFTDQAFHEYKSWIAEGNTKVADRIDALLEDIQNEPFVGLGKPHSLRGPLSGMWSRRITQKDRLVYTVEDDLVTVFQCRGHYDDH